MKPLGYFRALENLLTLMRTLQGMCDPGMDDAGNKLLQERDAAADAVDQAWSDLSKDDKLMVYNMAKHLTDNIKPARKEPEKPLIHLIH